MPPSPAKRRSRQEEAELTKQAILEAATAEFVEMGYAGSRVDMIAERTSTSKRMIYYYFGSKEGLYNAVLTDAYSKIRGKEQNLDYLSMSPVDAMRALVGLTFDHHADNPDFIRLIAMENVHRAEHLRRSEISFEVNHGAVDLLDRILRRGYADGSFERQIEALDLHQMISSLCFFRAANRHTFGAIFGRDLDDPAVKARQRVIISEMILSYIGGREER